jgi:hypothetical protein
MDVNMAKFLGCATQGCKPENVLWFANWEVEKQNQISFVVLS